VLDPKASGSWGRAELAELAGVVANGGADEHLLGLARLGLIAHDDQARRRWHATKPLTPLAESLTGVLASLRTVPDSRRARPEVAPSAALRVERALRGAELAASAASSELSQGQVSEILRLLDAAAQCLQSEPRGT
jgi:hypothetical protein